MTQPHINPIDAARALLASGQLDEALRTLQGSDEPHFRMARLVVLRAMGDYEAAIQEAQAVLRVQPGHTQAKTYLGMLRLHMGHADGWQLYRNRWDTPAWTETMHYPKAHLWDGRIQPNTTVLFWAEQGFGDTLQFVRYLPWLQQQGLQLQLQCPEPLQALFAQTLPQVPLFQPQPGSTSAFDAHLPLLDLPSLLPNFNPAFCNAPYLHIASAPTHTRGTVHPGVRVGMVWAGRPTHTDDANRSIHTAQLAPLWTVPGVHWVNLQQGEHAAPAPLGKPQVFGNFLDTARCIADLDLVITVDTSVAHLAGAMGKPVWVLLPFVPDWRWGVHTAQTPWYPSMRLYRQQRVGDWQGALNAVADDLTRLCLKKSINP
jgi:hypothetical protein